MPTLKDVIEYLETYAPSRHIEPGDPSGLQIGDPGKQIDRIGVVVDASISVIEQAVGSGIDLLITHHPLIYSPLKTLTPQDPVSGRVIKLVQGNIALFSMHTNLDVAPGGINDVLAECLELVNTQPLTITRREKLFKIAVFVPAESVDKALASMTDAGAGHIGNYSHCTFRTQGTGTFLPQENTNPYIGSIGQLTEANEFRLETVCPTDKLAAVLAAMQQAHPYEEVAYDVYELANELPGIGLGRVGKLASLLTIVEFITQSAEKLGISNIRVSSGDLGKPVTRVAVCGGAGGSLYPVARAAGADVFLTGDVRHHEMVDAAAIGLILADAGHFETERPGVKALAGRLQVDERFAGVAVEYLE